MKVLLVILCTLLFSSGIVIGQDVESGNLYDLQTFPLFQNIPTNLTETIKLIIQKFSEDTFKGDSLCLKEIRRVIRGARFNELWAISMLDASAKIQPGLLYGNVIHFGNYDECIAINEYVYLDEIDLASYNIKGQYCTTIISFGDDNNQTQGKELDLLFFPTFSLCVPSECSAEEIQSVANNILNKNKIDAKIILNEKLCSSEDSHIEIPTRSIIALVVFITFGFIILIATVVEVYNLWEPTEIRITIFRTHQQNKFRGALACSFDVSRSLINKSEIFETGSRFIVPDFQLLLIEDNRILRCFSMYTNGKKILTSKPSEDSLNCLNGIRVISMMCVLLGHRFLASARMPAVNRIFIEEWRTYWYNYIFIGLGFSVDTFFTVSGLLIVYLYFRTVEKGRKVHWSMFYLHRIIRLTPSMLMVVLFYSTMIQFVEVQPYPILDDIFGETCREYWWTTVLYIQNYWNPNDMCAVQTWYIAIDTQLYIVSPLLLLALKRYPFKAVCGIFALALLSICLAFGVTFEYSLGATFLNQGLEEYKNLYTPTHIRLPPWLFGAFTGYYIAKHKDEDIKLNKFLVFFLWIISVGSLIFVLLIQKTFDGVEYNVLSAASFNAFSRPIWGAAICLIVWLCVTGNGGIINSFLSCNFFNVLIRINYSIYLIHMMAMIAMVAKFRTPTYISNFSTIHDAIGDYCVVVFIATFWTLAFESPIIALEKVIFSQGIHEKRKYVLNYVDCVVKY